MKGAHKAEYFKHSRSHTFYCEYKEDYIVEVTKPMEQFNYCPICGREI